MENKRIQRQYDQVMNHIALLVASYPEAVKKLLEDYGLIFKGTPTAKSFSEAILEKLDEGDPSFEKALERLIVQLNPTEEDQFLGGLIKGAVGLVGGIIRKRKARRRARRASRSSSRSSSSSSSSISLARERRRFEQRIQQMRQEQLRREAEARRRREEEDRRRREEQVKREADSKRKTQTMLMVGGGVLVLGLGAVFMMRQNKPSYPYPMSTPVSPPMP
ncbi:hypothetical protein [Aquimarina agarilytica]|uniref:hypothetical protein n=1 Tax=Aquimarina agarilytica TaxID=1087449 RepID=UPI0002895C65|nr:hypothetical protein [Aquimarina agarilytica]